MRHSRIDGKMIRRGADNEANVVSRLKAGWYHLTKKQTRNLFWSCPTGIGPLIPDLVSGGKER